MATIITKTKLYIEDNSGTYDSTKVTFQNDGSGDYIKIWNYDFAKPTDEQLSSYETAGDTIENNLVVDSTREKEYGSWQDQLDEIYHNIDDWKTRIKTIKDKYPKG